MAAEKILSIAGANSVPIVQDPDLAGVLAGVGLDCEIPPRLYTAVAEILAYIAGLNRSAKRSQ